MSYDTIYHFSSFTIINTYWAFMKETEWDVLCTNSTALFLTYLYSALKHANHDTAPLFVHRRLAEVYREQRQGRGERVRVPVTIRFRDLPARGGTATNLYTKSGTLSLSCTVPWAWSEWIHLYSRQTMIVPRNTQKKICNIVGTWATSQTTGPRQFLPTSTPPPFGTGWQ
jgi:hypothetical protein